MDEYLILPIPFQGSCAAGDEEILSSDQIDSPFRVKRIRASFILGSNRLLHLKIFISLASQNPSSGEPTGYALLGFYGNVSYLAGDDEVVELEINSQIFNGGQHLKVYAQNLDTSTHTVDMIITLEKLQGD